MLYVESRKNFEVESGKKFNSLPSVKKHSANSHLCRVLKYNALGKELFAVCIYFAECFLYDTRQRPYLPSVRKNTLGKRLSTRQTSSFP